MNKRFFFYNPPSVGKHFQVDTGGTLTTGLVAYWKMEDSTDFWSTNNGTATSVTFSAGKVNNAGNFNGSTSKIDVTNTGFGITGSFTIACWVKCTALNLQANIFSKDPVISGQRDWQFRANSGGTLSFFRADSSMGALSDISTTTTINDGNWHLVIAEFDTSNGSAIYIDNVSRATSGITTAKTITNSLAQIGMRGDGQYPFTGGIDEIGLWAKALTNQERTDLYNSGSGQTMIS